MLDDESLLRRSSTSKCKMVFSFAVNRMHRALNWKDFFIVLPSSGYVMHDERTVHLWRQQKIEENTDANSSYPDVPFIYAWYVSHELLLTNPLRVLLMMTTVNSAAIGHMFRDGPSTNTTFSHFCLFFSLFSFRSVCACCLAISRVTY